jgi:hypothetical protein
VQPELKAKQDQQVQQAQRVRLEQPETQVPLAKPVSVEKQDQQDLRVQDQLDQQDPRVMV